MRRVLNPALWMFWACCAVSTPAVAAPSSGALQVRVSASEIASERTAAGMTRKITVRASLPKLGTVRVTLDQRYPAEAQATFTAADGTITPDRTPVQLLAGRAQTVAEEQRVAAAIVPHKGKPALTVSFFARGRRGGEADYYRLSLPVQGPAVRSGRLYRLPASKRFSQWGGCQMLHAPETAIRSAARRAVQTGTPVLRLGIDADAAWYKTFGSNSNAAMLTAVHEARILYEQQLGITFTVVRQNVFTRRTFGSTAAVEMLADYRAYRLKQQELDQGDLSVLFTGRDLDGSDVGVAYVGVVCRTPACAMGLVQNTASEMLPGIFAHELGHSFGTTHDTTLPATIMYPMAGSSSGQRFSEQSRAEISNFVAQYGSCLSAKAEAIVPPPLPLRILSQPKPAAAAPATRARFEIIVQGAAPFKYYWERSLAASSDWKLLSPAEGGESVLEVAADPLDDGSRFRVWVRDGGTPAVQDRQGTWYRDGATVSEVVELSVLQLTITPATTMIGQTGQQELQVTVAGGQGALGYQWFVQRRGESNWTLISGAEGPRYTASAAYGCGASFMANVYTNGNVVSSPPATLLVASHNAANPYDVNADGVVTALDVLRIMNYFNSKQPLVELCDDPLFFPDVNGDGYITPLDTLIVINYLNGL